jgi:hypothetical protein
MVPTTLAHTTAHNMPLLMVVLKPSLPVHEVRWVADADDGLLQAAQEHEELWDVRKAHGWTET